MAEAVRKLSPWGEDGVFLGLSAFFFSKQSIPFVYCHFKLCIYPGKLADATAKGKKPFPQQDCTSRSTFPTRCLTSTACATSVVMLSPNTTR